MKPAAKLAPRANLLAALAALSVPALHAQIVLSGSGTYTQNFNTLPTSGTSNAWTDNTTIEGWYAARQSGTVVVIASNGSSSTGGIYSFGTGTDTDRALGSVGSGTPGSMAWGVSFQNTSGGNITFSNFSYVGEQWRNGGNTSTQSLTFWYQISSSPITSLTPTSNTGWTAVSALDFTSPIATATAAALDGNAGANRNSLSNSLNLSLASGQYIMFRWLDIDHSGNDHGLAIDDVSISFSVPSVVSRGAGTVFTSSSFGGAAFTAADTAAFDGTGANVSLSGAVVAAGLNFSVAGYELSGGGADSIATTGPVDVSTGISATISGKITGSNPLAKNGTGTLVLSNTGNDFTGNVTLNAGTLEISSDANLGDSANDIVLGGGTLRAANSLSLGSGRDISGTGSLSVGSGNTLTIGGNLTNAGITLADSGTVALNGASNTVSAIGFSAPGTLTGNALTLNGNISTSAYSGTASIANAINAGSANRIFSIIGDLELTGAYSGTGRLSKQGAGTLTLSGDMSGLTNGIQLGVQGSEANQRAGGTLIVSANNALGTGQLQFNSGVLRSDTTRAFANTVSIGGRSGATIGVPTFAGADMVFTPASGTHSFFRASGATGALAFNVNNTTTFNGGWASLSADAGIQIGGNGRVIWNGSAAGIVDSITLVDTITFELNNALGGGINVASGTTLAGNGSAAGLVTVSAGGTLTPGLLFTATGGLALERGATVNFNLGTGTQVAGGALSLVGVSGIVDLDFGGTSTAAPGAFELFSFTSLAGGFNGSDLSMFQLSNLGAGTEASLAWQGSTLVLNVTAVPEPSAFATLAGLAAAGMAATRRKRRQTLVR
jgi:autotransporter-associated beta strand protein